MNKWRDIETAPKDGTAILALCPTQADRHHKNGQSPARVCFFGQRNWLSLPGWWTCHPTHWVPIPSRASQGTGDQ